MDSKGDERSWDYEKKNCYNMNHFESDRRGFRAFIILMGREQKY